jgi:uncharacterized membrane protein YtjA (UPF0391 family)
MKIAPVSERVGRFAGGTRIARDPVLGSTHQGGDMFYWAAVFLVIALLAAVFGFGGIAGLSAQIAWILFIVGLILAVVFFIFGRRGRGL